MLLKLHLRAYNAEWKYLLVAPAMRGNGSGLGHASISHTPAPMQQRDGFAVAQQQLQAYLFQ